MEISIQFLHTFDDRPGLVLGELRCSLFPLPSLQSAFGLGHGKMSNQKGHPKSCSRIVLFANIFHYKILLRPGQFVEVLESDKNYYGRNTGRGRELLLDSFRNKFW